MAYMTNYPNQYYQQSSPYYSNGAMPDMLSQQKMQYQPQMQQPIQTPIQPPQLPTQPQPVNDMLWVLGEVEATSYPVAPNNTVVLWDKDRPTVFVKSVNAQGVPSMRILDYVERGSSLAPIPAAPHVCKCGDNFVKIEDFKALEKKYAELLERVEKLSMRPSRSLKPKEVKEDIIDG